MKIMLIGKTGSGKTTLAQVLTNKAVIYKKTQDVIYDEDIIDIPGEYLENRAYYKALNVISVEAGVIIFIQNASDNQSFYPPSFSNMFFGKKVIGVITKIDINPDTKMAEDFLNLAGVEKIFKVDLISLKGVEELKEFLPV